MSDIKNEIPLEEMKDIAKLGFEKVATPELKELLKETGLSNHPEIIRAFYKAGQKIVLEA